MTHITIDVNNVIGKIKPMHGVGQPPMIGTNTDTFHYLTEANIPYARLHDVGGWFGGNLFVDIPNIFRNFDADENDPASYEFEFTDILIKGLMDAKCEPVYRLGVTIENFYEITAFRIFPPADMAKWARICEHIIRHYNEGWANGFRYNIQYWEIWNEPDGHPDMMQNGMWRATPEEYFELYRITSKHLRTCFGDSIKIGGYASCGFHKIKDAQDVTGEAFGITNELSDWDKRINHFMNFFYQFIDMVTTEKLPLDFFTWHSYSQPADNIRMQKFCEKYLEKAGLGDIEIHLNEWNPNPHLRDRGTSFACANAVANLCGLQDTKMAMMCYYDARLGPSVYGGLFNPLNHQPLCAYYGFQAFGKLYALGTQIACSCDNNDMYATAATNGEETSVLLTNLGEQTTVELNVPHFKAYLIDQNNTYTEMEVQDNRFNVEKHQVIYIEI